MSGRESSLPGGPSPGRIKRQVQGREHRFALVCPPGFEAVCLDEARRLGLSLVPLPGADAVQSGPVLEWTGRLEDLYRACLFLRVASRVLVRLDSFRAGAREELFRHCCDFPWELWLPSGCALKVEAHVRHSRISHEGMTAETVREAIARRMARAGLASPVEVRGGSPEATGGETADEDSNSGDDSDEGIPTEADGMAASDGQAPCQRVIVHLEDNHARISLDASGDHLHRRGWRTVHGAAPIRENLAAGLLLWAGWPTIAGDGTDNQSGERILVDGMCGSGTFCIEAAGILAGASSSGAVDRDFAFRHWPSWTPGPYQWWRRQCLPWPGESKPVWRISGSDSDPAMVALAAANWLRWRGDTIESPGVFGGSGRELPAIDWTTGDFFEREAPDRGLLVLNPPYGLRLSDGGGSLYPRLFRHLASRWTACPVLLLGPSGTDIGPMAARLLRQLRFRHGGLAINAWLFASGLSDTGRGNGRR